MNVHEAMARYCGYRAVPLRGAFRRGLMWAMRGGVRGMNPYRHHRNERGWGNRYYAAWDEGYRVATSTGLSLKETTDARRGR